MPNGATEKSITRSIQSWLKTQPEVWQFKVHGGPYQTAGIPDIVGCWSGRFFALEVKGQRGYPTVLQTKTLEKIREAGGLAAVVKSLDEVKGLFGE